jgi:hypothetical protein
MQRARNVPAWPRANRDKNGIQFRSGKGSLRLLVTKLSCRNIVVCLNTDSRSVFDVDSGVANESGIFVKQLDRNFAQLNNPIPLGKWRLT